jgi:hypothetical protein
MVPPDYSYYIKPPPTPPPPPHGNFFKSTADRFNEIVISKCHSRVIIYEVRCENGGEK